MSYAEHKDLFGNKIKLTKERWNHITLRHPEMSMHFDNIPKVLKEPDIIIKSRIIESTKLYHKKHKDYYLVVVADTQEKFIVTAYTSYRIKEGELEWKKN